MITNTWLRRTTLLTTLLISGMVTGCTMRGSGKSAAPAFSRSSRQHPFPVTPRSHRVEALEVQIVSASMTEVYTVLGTVDWTVRLNVVFANTDRQPLTVPASSMIAHRTSGGTGTAAYFSSVTLAPGERKDAVITIPAGLSRLDKPLALAYQGVRMELN